VPGATLVQHRHCASCGKAILPSRTTCEGDCEQQFARIRKKRKQFWLMWLAATLLLVAIVISLGPR
jgi:predicted nucleic acid-binding Zn ribbon protein